MAKHRIAVFSGPTATIGNSPALITSNKARRKYGLPLMTNEDGGPQPDVLRPQRLAAPAVVYVEAYSAHPLEADAVELYASPDGWLASDGVFHETKPAAGGTPVFVVEIHPEDGLIPLPYMARQADGSAWDDATAYPFAPPESSRQTFYPDASRIYEEMERLYPGPYGGSVALSSIADFDFVRAAPSGGWKRGRPAELRTDFGEGDIEPERFGLDFQGYFPFHLMREPHLEVLAKATNIVQRTLATGRYSGAQWLEGSPTTEETLYWLSLLLDTTLPIVGHVAQRPHGSISADGPRNIADGVSYIVSGIALDGEGRDRVGPVLIVDELAYAARDVAKTDGRPGAFVATGGHGGPVAGLGGAGLEISYVPAKKHTYKSDVRITTLPRTVMGVAGVASAPNRIEVRIKNDLGDLIPEAMPLVTFSKYARYGQTATGEAEADPATEVEILARIEANLSNYPLAGFVAEGASPYGLTNPAATAALRRATFSGMPVVRVGRGNTAGKAYELDPFLIPGNNLTATKARILLMAALLKLGGLPPAADPRNPTAEEQAATLEALKPYRDIFATH